LLSVIVIDDQQNATILVSLFIPNQLYMFRAMFSTIIRSNVTVFTAFDIMHRYCCWLVSWMRFHLILMMGENIARNM